MDIKITADIIPDYPATVCRPLLRNVPEGHPGWVQTFCPYCGAPCWKLPQEPDPLPPHIVAACTGCALMRSIAQEEMDAQKAARDRA